MTIRGISTYPKLIFESSFWPLSESLLNPSSMPSSRPSSRSSTSSSSRQSSEPSSEPSSVPFPGTNTDQYLDVCAIAEALEDSGVTTDSVILVWHSTYYDLTLLGNFLEPAGANSLLPSRANCVRLVPHVRANIPPHNGKPFPATLSTIFPILFPRHELVGRNHRALVDCQQTRLVMMAFEEFAKPISSPGRLDFSDNKPTQQTLDHWFVHPTLVSHDQEIQNLADGMTPD